MRRLMWLALACALVCPAFATNTRTSGFCEDGGWVPVTNGVIASGVVPIGSISPNFTNGTGVMGNFPGCTVTVYLSGTLTLASIFSDSGGTPKANPFTASLVDGSWFFWVANGTYDIQLSSAGIVTPVVTSTYTVLNVGGSDTDVQVNCSGLFCGYAGLTWITGTSTLNATNEAITTALTIGGGSALTTSNHTGTGNIVLATAPTIATPTISNETVTGTNTLSGTNNFSGANNFDVSSNALTVLDATGNAEITLSAASGGHTASGGLFAVATNAHNGEMQWQIADTSPFGWRFCATNGLTLCPLLIDGGSGLSGTSGITLTNAVSDITIVMSSTFGSTVSSQTLDSVATNGRAGEFEFRMNSGTPDPAAAWEFVNTNGTVTPVSLNVNAPNHSLIVNGDGTVTIPAAIKTGTSSNTDQAGACTLGTNCAPAVTFSASYAVAPICTASDSTAANAVKIAVTTTTLTLTGTGTDNLEYICVPRH